VDGNHICHFIITVHLIKDYTCRLPKPGTQVAYMQSFTPTHSRFVDKFQRLPIPSL